MPDCSNTEAYMERVLNIYGNMILRIAFQQVKNRADAEDIVQEVFIRLIKAAPVFEEEGHEKAWLIRVTVNLCRDFHKSSWNRKREYLDEALPAPEKEEEKGLLEVVRQLPRKYRDVIYLFYYEEYSIAQIAQILDKKEATVGSWLYRARKLLKRELEQGGQDYV